MTTQDPTPRSKVWDPFGTLRNALWIAGGQWAGKFTIARILAARYGLTTYHYDYHDARAHNDRRIQLGQPPDDPDPNQAWVNTTPRLTRDHHPTQDATRSAHNLSIHVIEVDGSHNANTVADIVAGHSNS